MKDNRAARGLVAILMLAVLGGSVMLMSGHRRSLPSQPDDLALYFQQRGLVMRHQSHLPSLWKRVTLLPRSDWGFGRYTRALICDGSIVVECKDELKLGFYEFQLQ